MLRVNMSSSLPVTMLLDQWMFVVLAQLHQSRSTSHRL